MSFAERAVRFRERRQASPVNADTHREISEESEESPATSGGIPLDQAIAADIARRTGVEEIRRRLARCEASAARPDASALDRQLVADWRAILAAKGG